MHIRRGEFERFYCGSDARNRYPNHVQRVVEKGHILSKDLLSELFIRVFMDLGFRPEYHPLLIVEPIMGYDDTEKHGIRRIAFTILASPSVTFVNAAILVACDASVASGLVISFGHETSAIAGIFKGELIEKAKIATGFTEVYTLSRN